ncbi:flavin reductase family protein [Methanolacinia petrolearia]|uniref:flavin reductase family protein n=1 Tax=Methanolacinia petrolearia TaxID=54120 RepID=UPI003BA8A3B7
MMLKPFERENVLAMPVVLISTVSGSGVANVAPWGNVTPILRPLDNIREIGEFVINVPPASMIDEVMICSRLYPPDVDEFAEAGLSKKSSSTVSAPGIAGCVAWIECKLKEEILRDKYSLVIGQVTVLEVKEDFVTDDGDLDYENAEPLCMLCGGSVIHYTKPVRAGRTAQYSEMFSWPGKKQD